MAQCKCCEREMELRMGFCFDCADAESVIVTGVNMWDEDVKQEGMSTALSKLKYILNIFDIIKNK
jgi:hypothetical protein